MGKGILSSFPSVTGQPSSVPTGQLLSATAHHCWLLGRAVTSSVPGHYHWIRTARPNVLSWPCSAGCCYRCLTATAQISSSGRQKVHPVQDTAPGSVQATRVFPLVKTDSELLSSNWVLSDSSSMCAGTFGVQDAAEGRCSCAFQRAGSLLFYPCFVWVSFIPCQTINLIALSFHYLYFFFACQTIYTWFAVNFPKCMRLLGQGEKGSDVRSSHRIIKLHFTQT